MRCGWVRKSRSKSDSVSKSRGSFAQPGRNGKEVQTKSEAGSGCKAYAFL